MGRLAASVAILPRECLKNSRNKNMQHHPPVFCLNPPHPGRFVVNPHTGLAEAFTPAVGAGITSLLTPSIGDAVAESLANNLNPSQVQDIFFREIADGDAAEAANAFVKGEAQEAGRTAGAQTQLPAPAAAAAVRNTLQRRNTPATWLLI